MNIQEQNEGEMKETVSSLSFFPFTFQTCIVFQTCYLCGFISPGISRLDLKISSVNNFLQLR